MYGSALRLFLGGVDEQQLSLAIDDVPTSSGAHGWLTGIGSHTSGTIGVASVGGALPGSAWRGSTPAMVPTCPLQVSVQRPIYKMRLERRAASTSYTWLPLIHKGGFEEEQDEHGEEAS